MTDYSWILKIRKGDVLESGTGKLRVVRAVSKHKRVSIANTYITFAIARCSWTHRPYTVYTGNDLRQMRYKPIGIRHRLRAAVDRDIEKSMKAESSSLCPVHCCDVVGLP